MLRRSFLGSLLALCAAVAIAAASEYDEDGSRARLQRQLDALRAATSDEIAPPPALVNNTEHLAATQGPVSLGVDTRRD